MVSAVKVKWAWSVAIVVAALMISSAPALTQAPQQQPPPPAVPTFKEQVEVVATRLPETPHDVPAAVEVLSGDQLRALGATNLRDVDRVEVLRGSAPVTFGATSFVGVIHVVHKSGAAAGRNAAFRVGSFSSGGGALDIALPQAGSWKSRLTVDFDRQGYRDDRTSYTRGHASYRAGRGGQDGRTWVMADLNWLNQDPASPHPREGTALSSNVAIDANYNPAGASLNDTRVTGAFGTERSLHSGVQWNLTGSFSHSGQSQFRGFLTDIANSADNATGLRENIDINDVYADTHFTWPERSHVRFVAGGDFLFGNGEGRGATFTYTVPLSAGTATDVNEPTNLNLDTGARRSFFGGYLLADYTPSPRVRLSGGLRLNATRESHGEGETVTNTRPGGNLGAVFSLREQGADHVRLFASYRNTFKPAAFDFSLAENEGVLKPETAQSYEGGVKIRTAAGRVDVEASGFRMAFENLVTSTVVGGLPALINAGRTRFQGFEIASAILGAHDISGRLTYSFHDGRFVDFVQAFDGVPQQLGGNRFEMSARHLFSAGIVVAPERGVVGSVVVKYMGDRFLNMRNAALADPFTTVDAGLGYRQARWEIRLDGRNLTDRRDAVSESEIGDAQYYLLPARRIDLTVGVRF